MKFAICNETFDGWKLPDALVCAAALGYQGVELAPYTLANDVREIPSEGRRRLRHLVESHGLVVTGLHWLLARTSGLHLTSPDPSARQRTTAYLIELMRFCADLGGTVLVFGSPKQRDLAAGLSFEQGLDLAAEVFRKVMPEAERLGVTIAFEPLARQETNFINTAEQAAELIRRVSHPCFRLHLDVRAMCDMGRPVPQIVRQHREHVAYFHANDPDGRGPGVSGFDHAPVAAALREIGYDGWVSVEVFQYQPDPRAIAAEALAYLRRVYG